MDEILEEWIRECGAKGTFRNRDEAIEFCVGFTREMGSQLGIDASMLMKEPPVTWETHKGDVVDSVEALSGMMSDSVEPQTRKILERIILGGGGH